MFDFSRKSPLGFRDALYQLKMLLLGFISIALGAFALLKNRELAIRLGSDDRMHQGLASSVARQNIAVIGAVLVAVGLGMIVVS